MLNRTRQVLLEKWLDDYIEILTKKYDLSTSSVIKAHMCLAIVCLLPRLYPEYKTNSIEEEMVKFAKKVSKKEQEDVEVHHMLSNITYEARKAIEFWSTKEKT